MVFAPCICHEMIARMAQRSRPRISSRSRATRAAVRQKLSKPIVEALRPWLEAGLQDLFSANDLAKHIRYGLKR
jgi:transposase